MVVGFKYNTSGDWISTKDTIVLTKQKRDFYKHKYIGALKKKFVRNKSREPSSLGDTFHRGEHLKKKKIGES